MKHMPKNRSENLKVLLTMILIIALLSVISFLLGRWLRAEGLLLILPVIVGILLICVNGYVVYGVFKVEKQLIPKLLLITSAISTLIIYLIYGVYEGIDRYHCMGFFGVGESCVEHTLYPLAMFGVPLLFMGIGMIVISLRQAMMKYVPRPTKHSKRDKKK